jgi:hypothetical protein
MSILHVEVTALAAHGFLDAREGSSGRNQGCGRVRPLVSEGGLLAEGPEGNEVLRRAAPERPPLRRSVQAVPAVPKERWGDRKSAQSHGEPERGEGVVPLHQWPSRHRLGLDGARRARRIGGQAEVYEQTPQPRTGDEPPTRGPSPGPEPLIPRHVRHRTGCGVWKDVLNHVAGPLSFLGRDGHCVGDRVARPKRSGRSMIKARFTRSDTTGRRRTQTSAPWPRVQDRWWPHLALGAQRGKRCRAPR